MAQSTSARVTADLKSSLPTVKKRPFSTLHNYVKLEHIDAHGNLLRSKEQSSKLKKLIGQKEPLTSLSMGLLTLAATDRAGFIKSTESNDYDVIYHGDRVGRIYRKFAGGSYADVHLLNDGKSWSAVKIFRESTSLKEVISEFDAAKKARIAEFVVFEKDVAMIGMSLVPGENLDDILKRGRLPTSQRLGFISATFEELDRVHQLGITHRDVKPANMMASGYCSASLVDFGLAVEATWVRRKEFELGTPLYMAPELQCKFQIRGKYSSQEKMNGSKIDIYAAGVMTAEICGLWPANFVETDFRKGYQVPSVDSDEFKKSPIRDEGIRKEMLKLLKGMTERTPQSRFDLATCKSEVKKMQTKAEQTPILKAIIDVAEVFTLLDQLEKMPTPKLSAQAAQLRRVLKLADMVYLVQSKELDLIQRTRVMRFLNPFKIVHDQQSGKEMLKYTDDVAINVRSELFHLENPAAKMLDVVAGIADSEKVHGHINHDFYVFVTTTAKQVLVLDRANVIVLAPHHVLPGIYEKCFNAKYGNLFARTLADANKQGVKLQENVERQTMKAVVGIV